MCLVPLVNLLNKEASNFLFPDICHEAWRTCWSALLCYLLLSQNKFISAMYFWCVSELLFFCCLMLSRGPHQYVSHVARMPDFFYLCIKLLQKKRMQQGEVIGRLSTIKPHTVEPNIIMLLIISISLPEQVLWLTLESHSSCGSIAFCLILFLSVLSTYSWKWVKFNCSLSCQLPSADHKKLFFNKNYKRSSEERSTS